MKCIFNKIIFLHPVTTTTLGVMLHGLRLKQVNMPITYSEYSHPYLPYSPASKIHSLFPFVPCIR